jgi:UDP-N-acetylglucosamine 2-epimerase
MVLVPGDTNSSLAAGAVLISDIAVLDFATTHICKRNLLQEGKSTSLTFVTRI